MSDREDQNKESFEISRRKLLTIAGAGGAAALAIPLIPSIASGAADTHADIAPMVPAFDLEELSVADLQGAMASGRLTSRAVTEKYLARIATVDRQGPSINQIIELNPDALAIADAMDAERKAGKTRGSLHGIPVLIKDNIDTHDRMATTAGSLALAGTVAPRDAFLVQRLREAGAVILGKTNLSEWANFRSTHSSSGWSGRGGQTRNPYALDRSPSGSSSGSAGAVSANLCAVAVGSETDGSIVSPSSVNGVVGIKPTVGLVSRSGIIPISHSQDTAGPIARTVADAAALLTVLAGADPNDEATGENKAKPADYTTSLDRTRLKGARIGVVRAKGFGLTTKSDPILANAVEVMKREGAAIVDPVEIDSLGKFDDSELAVLLYEFKADLNRYLASRPDIQVHSLADLIAFNERNAAQEMPFFGQELFIQAQEKGPLTTKEYVDALAKNHKLARTEGIDAAMTKHKLDALVMITNGPSWLIDLVNGDYFTGGSSSLAAVAGYPSITVPAGFVQGLPVGISFTGRAWSEASLIGIAYAFEQATKARLAPQFRPSVT